MEAPLRAVETDDTDLQILDELTRNGRATLQDVGDRIGLRRPSVHARVKKLEAAGVIRGYHADVDPDAVGAGLVAFVRLSLECGPGSDCMTASSRAAEALRAVPEVLEFHVIAGEDDALVKVRARDMRDLQRLTTKVISGAPGVGRIRTMIALSSAFERPLAPVRRRGRAVRKR